jgi:uncharacterized membrane protein YdjX (TVP38/TMEM64 family)
MIQGKSIFYLLAIFIGIPCFIKTWNMDIHTWATGFDLWRGIIVGIIGIIAGSGIAFRIFIKLISEAIDLWYKIKSKKIFHNNKKQKV